MFYPFSIRTMDKKIWPPEAWGWTLNICLYQHPANFQCYLTKLT